MDSIVTVQFFRASADNGDVSGFENAIMNQAAKPTPTEREIDLGRGIFFRLERCESDGDFIVGEFCRKQITNIPPQAGNLGLSKIILSDGHGLGHVSAFRYHIPTKILAFQQNRMCGSPARISLYIKSCSRRSIITFKPVLREDAWERLRNKEIKSFRIKFAAPENLSAIDTDQISAAKNARMLATAYNGPEVEIAVSVGRRPGQFLNKINVLNTLFGIRSSSVSVTKMEANTSDDEGSDPIDFIKEHLKQSKNIELPDGSPDDNYQARKLFISQAFSDMENYLLRQFGERSHGNAG